MVFDMAERMYVAIPPQQVAAKWLQIMLRERARPGWVIKYPRLQPLVKPNSLTNKELVSDASLKLEMTREYSKLILQHKQPHAPEILQLHKIAADYYGAYRYAV
jgi:hypothetical protein